MRLLLTLVTTAGTYRHTDGPPVDLTGPDGVTSYKAGLLIDAAALDVVLSEGADLSPRTVACSIPDLGVIEWDAVGVGVLAGIPDDATTLAAASPIVVGRLDELAVAGAVVTLNLVEDPLDDRGLILDDAATVSALTWPRGDTERAADGVAAYVGTTPASSPTVEGAHYPVLIGSPGQGASLRAIGMLLAVAYPAAPALLVETSDSVTSATDHAFVVSAGRIDASTVRRISTDRTGEPMSETAAVVVGHDLQGRIVSMISAGTALTSPSEESESWVCLDSGYGIADPYGSGPLRRADRVIRYALDRSTLRVDRRCLGRLEALRGHVVDVGIFWQVGAWEWLSGQVLPSLPVAVTSGPLGLSIWPVILGADPSMVEGTLEVGRNAKILRDPVADPWAPVTRCTVRYRLDARSGSPRSSVTVAGRRRPTDPSTLPISLWAARAWAAVGERSETIDAPWTANDATAMLLAQHRIDATCRPSWTVVAAVPERDAPEVGALVRLIHRDLAIDAVAQVAALSYSGGTAQITLRWRARLGRPE